jgi:Flp pilus assembly protein TadD
MAAIMAEGGDLDGAQDIARRLREKHPNAVEPIVLQAELLQLRGDLMGAARAYDTAMDIELIDSYAIRAHQLRNRADDAQQMDPLRRYLRERPLDMNVRIFLAHSYRASGEIGNSTKEYETVLEHEPENFVALNNLANNYLEQGDVRAVELARRAYKLRPDNGHVADTLGWVLVKTGDVEKGVSLLQSAVELSNGHPEIRYHLAVALVESGGIEEARSILEALLESKQPFASKKAAESLFASL